MSEANDNVIIARRLTKVFRDFWLRDKVAAVSELELEIRPREVYGLLGPNGSGKSTTLKMILGLLFPTRGQIRIFGKRPSDVAVKNRIGFLPEESYLYPFLDARETLDFYGRLFHQPRRERVRRIDMLLEMVGLSSAAYRRVGEYSKGMQRRIGLAQALINDPDLLILDEPTSGMDPIGTRQFKDLIRTLALRGKTVILSSHLLADVEDVCDRVCVLYGGKKRAEGTLDELLCKEDRMQFVTGRLDDATVTRIREILAQSCDGDVAITAPRAKLEDLFLQIVQDAQRQGLVTGGAAAGGAVAAFLRGEGADEGRSVIEDLVASAEPAAPEPAARQSVPVDDDDERPDDEPEIDAEQIARLINERQQAQQAARSESPRRPARDEPRRKAAASRELGEKAAEQADRSVIDGLLDTQEDH